MEEFDDYELIEELESRNYDFAKEVSEEDMIDCLAYAGYHVSKKEPFLEYEGIHSLDSTEQKQLLEILEKFRAGSWVEKEIIYKNVMG